jgi:hypothetical protein
MDALIKISSSEFNEEVFKKIKALLKSVGDAEVIIAITNRTEGFSRKESKEEYWARLDKSIKDIEQGNGVTFTMEELEEYIKMPGK